MKRHNIIIALLVTSILLFPVINTQAQTGLPIVHAVLFYSPTCGHCQLVINETILPMMDQYGDQLQIIGIDVSQQQGQIFFMSAMKKFNLESAGVPFLVIDDTYMVGSLDIPEKFPGMVETYLVQGGLDWPDIPELNEAIARSSVAANATAAAANTSTDNSTATVPTQAAALQTTPVADSDSPTASPPITNPGITNPDAHNINWKENFSRDLAGNTLLVIILVGMLASIAWAVQLFYKTDDITLKGNWAWIIPILCLIGFGVAGYLAYVETTQVEAVCGPVGDCNTVQQSEYARLFGILPIGVLGLFGYVAIFISWMVARFTNGRFTNIAVLSFFTMTTFGTLFSIYLTFLEPFVIGATCAWCLTSAVLMTILMLLSVQPAKLAYSRISLLTSPNGNSRKIGVHHD